MTRHLATLSFLLQCRAFSFLFLCIHFSQQRDFRVVSLMLDRVAQCSFELWALFSTACFIIAWAGMYLKPSRHFTAEMAHTLACSTTVIVEAHAPTTRHGIGPILENGLCGSGMEASPFHSQTTITKLRGVPRTRLCRRWAPITSKLAQID